MTLIRHFPDGATLTFARGRFDDWCLLLTNKQVHNYAPKDWQYFTRFKQLVEQYDAIRLYRDFVRVYDATDASLNPAVLRLITQIAQSYPTTSLTVELLFSILYATMVAEENKHKAILKKRIKRLAIHQLLLEDVPVEQVVQFSKGKRWQEVDAECRRRGF